MESINPDYVRELVVSQGYAHEEVAYNLQQTFGGKGFSSRSVRRFCQSHGISRRSSVNEEELDAAVANCVQQVGNTWGRKMVQGWLRTQGMNSSRHKLRASLKRVNGDYHRQRQRGAEKMLNPTPYWAPFFGYNAHLDQNEKAVDYGIVVVLMVDGASKFITSWAVMPRKNNIVIYDKVFRIKLRHVIHGCPKRLWVEINKRCIYHVKACWQNLEEVGSVNAADPVHLFALSQVGMMLVEYGVDLVVQAWNCHPVKGGEAPADRLSAANGNLLVESQDVLPPIDATNLYNEYASSGLTAEGDVGEDLLSSDELKGRRGQLFLTEMAKIGSVPEIFGWLVNGYKVPAQNLVVIFLNLTYAIYNGEV